MDVKTETTFINTELRYYKAAVKDGLSNPGRPELIEKVKILLKNQARKEQINFILEAVRVFKHFRQKDETTSASLKKMIRPTWSFMGAEDQAELIARIKQELNTENFKLDGD